MISTVRFASAVLVALLMHAPVQGIDIDNPPAGVFADEWYAVMFHGQKSGHMHATMERIKGPGKGQGRTDHIRTTTDMTLEVGRAGTRLKVGVVQQTTETLDGKPVSFSNRMQMGALPIPNVTQGRIENGKVNVTASQFGTQAQPKTYDLPEGAMMSWAVYREQMKRGLEPGTRYSLNLYEPSLSPARLTPMTMEIFTRETIDLFGRKVEAIKTKQTMTLKNMIGQKTKLDTITWMTTEGDAVRMEMTMMNIPIHLLACTKSVALSPNNPAELMVDNLIPVDQPINRNARTITYRIAITDKSGSVSLPDLPETDMQKIEKKSQSGVQLRVNRRRATLGLGKAKLLSKQERERCLASSALFNYKDPVVARLAKQASGNEKDPLKLADRLRRFVGDYVQSKNLSVGFASASEVARSREGDCTEHGILLAALGRAVGIPTRVVTGVVYVESFAGRARVFGGHLWTQFWINGWWIDLDAAQDQTLVDPTHIALSISDAGDAGLADLVNSVWLNLGSLKITVLKSE